MITLCTRLVPLMPFYVKLTNQAFLKRGLVLLVAARSRQRPWLQTGGYMPVMVPAYMFLPMGPTAPVTGQLCVTSVPTLL